MHPKSQTLLGCISHYVGLVRVVIQNLYVMKRKPKSKPSVSGFDLERMSSGMSEL